MFRMSKNWLMSAGNNTGSLLNGKRPPLLDRFGRVHNYLRISLTERCNLRCRYCMPEQGIELTEASKLTTSEEIMRLVNLFASVGVDKVRLTGGEPLVRPDIIPLCQGIRDVEGIQTLGITTNGILLPRKIQDLHHAGVNALNISLDTFDESKYIFITRRNGLSKVLDSIRMAEHLGYDPVKINCVVMRGMNEDEIPKFVALTKDHPVEVRFIEFMPFDDNRWSRAKMVPFMEMMDIAEAGVNGIVPATDESLTGPTVENSSASSSPTSQGDLLSSLAANKWERVNGEHTSATQQGRQRLAPLPGGETAALFRFEGYRGRLGFITSMTSHFCGGCNRIRLTADGNLKVCLFGEDELSLTALMRGGATDDELVEAIRGAVSAKHFSHGGNDSAEQIAAGNNRSMIRIGG